MTATAPYQPFPNRFKQDLLAGRKLIIDYLAGTVELT